MFLKPLFPFSLHSALTQSMDEILNSVEEKVEEGETWVEPEDPADSFSKTKEQEDLMKVRKDVVPFLNLPQVDHCNPNVTPM